MSDFRDQPIDGQWVILHTCPGGTRQCLRDAFVQQRAQAGEAVTDGAKDAGEDAKAAWNKATN